ncbi:Aste57867_5234 [Aphanomyces stellatus]|uniref:Aste57867_5234 protein n=1 Tax=Aphanomyces stellatus TaxID=120398 RepID=A0A485KHB6_9STRA|nr:hypothetical protein As57867_005221 [Aphanomyces stellatus]VFT82307.1 Aste57867_5234 [Aphanomyces stellatus]
MSDVQSFFNAENRVVIARALVFVTSLIGFFCSTGTTGVSSTDYMFLILFTTCLYLGAHFYWVTYAKVVTVLPFTQFIVDAVLAILLLAAGIAVACFGWLPSSGKAACAFTFIATLFQVAVVALLYLGGKPAVETVQVQEDASTNFVVAGTPTNDAPVKEVKEGVEESAV